MDNQWNIRLLDHAQEVLNEGDDSYENCIKVAGILHNSAHTIEQAMQVGQEAIEVWERYLKMTKKNKKRLRRVFVDQEKNMTITP